MCGSFFPATWAAAHTVSVYGYLAVTGLNVRTRSTNMDTGTQDAEFRFREWAGSTGFVLRINYAVPEEPERAYCPISGNQHRPEPSGRSQGHINPVALSRTRRKCNCLPFPPFPLHVLPAPAPRPQLPLRRPSRCPAVAA